MVDASEYELGRLATRIAQVLRGKHKPTFTPHVDAGDFVVVLNASQVKLTGRKMELEKYQQYSGYPGGIREISYAEMLQKHPARVIEIAVKGMLPHTSLGRDMYRKLKVYAGDKHPHAAQMPGAKVSKGSSDK